MVLVRETVTADWEAWRNIRLQALRDAPDAFASIYAEQVKLGEAHWRQRVAGGGLFLAARSGPGPEAKVTAAGRVSLPRPQGG